MQPLDGDSRRWLQQQNETAAMTTTLGVFSHRRARRGVDFPINLPAALPDYLTTRLANLAAAAAAATAAGGF